MIFMHISDVIWLIYMFFLNWKVSTIWFCSEFNQAKRNKILNDFNNLNNILHVFFNRFYFWLWYKSSSIQLLLHNYCWIILKLKHSSSNTNVFCKNWSKFEDIYLNIIQQSHLLKMMMFESDQKNYF